MWIKVTFGRASDTSGELRTACQMAVCAAAEELQMQEAGGVVASASNDGYSETYVAAAQTPASGCALRRGCGWMVPACFSGERAVHVDVQRNTDPLYARYGAMMAKHIPAHRFWVRAGTAKAVAVPVQTARVSRTPIKAVFQPKICRRIRFPGRETTVRGVVAGSRARPLLCREWNIPDFRSRTTGAAGCTGR